MVKIFGINLKPELDSGKYYLHILILALVVQFILAKFGNNTGGLFTIHTLHFSIAIILGDILAHSLLKLD